jgi:microcystin-dependent protein
MLFSFARRFASLVVLAFIGMGSASHAQITTDRFAAEAFLMAGSFCPDGHVNLAARGHLLPINNSYPQLYAKLGIAYGGDGRITWALPVLDAENERLLGLGVYGNAPVWCISAYGADLSQASGSSARAANLILALPDAISDCPADYQLRNDVELRRFQEVDPWGTWKLPLRWCEATSNTGSRADHYLSELILVNGSTCPSGFQKADGSDGSIVSVSSNEALFSIIGPNYGGNGREHFAVPDMYEIFEGVPGTVWCIAMTGVYPSPS